MYVNQTLEQDQEISSPIKKTQFYSPHDRGNKTEIILILFLSLLLLLFTAISVIQFKSKIKGMKFFHEFTKSGEEEQIFLALHLEIY